MKLEIGKKYYVWDKTYSRGIYLIKLIKETPKKIYYETIKSSLDDKYSKNRFNYNTQILKHYLNIFDNLEDCKKSLNEDIKKEIDFKLNRIEILKKKKKEFNSLSLK